jgi:membrane protein
MPLTQPKRTDRSDWLMQVAYTTLRLFLRNGLQNHAAATAFYFMLSATPLLLLLALGTQWLTRLAETSNLATIMLAALYEQLHLDALTEMGFIPSQSHLTAGGVGLLTLVLSSRGLVNAAQSAFKTIFPDEPRRRPVLMAWLMPLVIIPIAFMLVGLAAAIHVILGYLGQVELLGAQTAHALRLLSSLFAGAILWALIALAYWRMPATRPEPRLAALLAMLATLSLAALIFGFDLFFKVERYRAVYGALGGVVFILIGAYFAAIVFYLWAQCLYALGKVDVAALEKLIIGSGVAGNALEGYVFGRADRLLNKYGRAYTPGEMLISEGDAESRDAFYLHSGRVALFKNIQGHQEPLGSLEQGQFFGEMAYLLGEARTATITAETEVVALVLPPRMLEELMGYSAPLSRRIVNTLAQRLMRMNQAAARESAPRQD